MIENEYIYPENIVNFEKYERLSHANVHVRPLPIFINGLNCKLNCSFLTDIEIRDEIDKLISETIHLYMSKRIRFYCIRFKFANIVPHWAFEKKEDRDRIYNKLKDIIKFKNILE